jgi:hypothetical protein
MMSVWHLLWIVPVSGFIGFLGAALFRANGR